MRTAHRLLAFVRAVFRSGRIDTDLAEEMRFHIEREVEANIARGLSPAAARRAARLTFGSLDASHELSRDDRPGALMRQFGRDVTFGARLLAKAPAFALTAVAIVALGVGAATAIFSVVYGVMLHPLPFREPDRLVTIWMMGGNGARMYPSAADAAELRALPGVFTDVALVRSSSANLSLVDDSGEPRHVEAARISPNLLGTLGVSPAIGRAFTADEDRAGSEHVVLLSDALWRGRYDGNPDVVGRQIRFSGEIYTVVGIMGPEFQYPVVGVNAWIPAVLEPGELARTTVNNYRLIARLDRRMTLDATRREVSALAQRLGRAYHPMTWSAGASYAVDSILDDAVRTVRPALTLLLGAVSFLVLVACINLSSLFGARASSRTGEFALRLALGASQSRLIVQAMAEAVPVLLIGGAIGLGGAWLVIRAFVASAPAGLPRLDAIALHTPVALCSLGLLIVAGFAASIAPAVQARRSDFASATKGGSRWASGGPRLAAARRLNVALQIAFALPLLIGASVMIQSAVAVRQVDLGFTRNDIATFSFDVSRSSHESDASVAEYYARIVDAVRALPGVQSAAITNRIPLAGGQTNAVRFDRVGGSGDDQTEVDTRTVTPDYFSTLGIPLLAGRTFTDHDDAAAPPVAIIDDRIARAMWPGEQALGKRFRGPGGELVTVVGIVGHVRATSVEADPHAQIYWSTRQWVQNRAVLAVRSRLAERALVPAVTAAIRALDPEQSVFGIRTMDEIVERSLASRRLTTVLMIAFATIALVMAAVGTYGVVAFGVSRRRREFGIRIALGATSRAVTRLVVWQGVSMAGLGSIVGLGLALAAGGMLRNVVYGVAPRNVTSFVVATGVLMLVAWVASYIPARRAASVHPSVTLRTE